MKTIDEFIKNLVIIDYDENIESFGHYPFQLFVENSDGTHELNALAVNRVEHVYDKVLHYKNRNAKRIYASLDFPKGGDIETDFVIIFCYEDGVLKTQAIPYNPMDGNRLEPIFISKHLSEIERQFKDFIGL